MNEVWTVLNVRMFSRGSRVGECAHEVQVQSWGKFAVVIYAVPVCVCVCEVSFEGFAGGCQVVLSRF